MGPQGGDRKKSKRSETDLDGKVMDKVLERVWARTVERIEGRKKEGAAGGGEEAVKEEETKGASAT